MTATAPCAVASAARSVRSAERSSSRSTSTLDSRAGRRSGTGLCADVFLLHHKHYPFQRPNARPARSRRPDSVRENARGTAPCALRRHTRRRCCRPRQSDGPRGERCARSNTLRVFARIAERLAPAVRGAPGENAATSPIGGACLANRPGAQLAPRAAEMFDRDGARSPALALSALVDFGFQTPT
jgi:hypothetical protein